jgi:hypothetical protein
MLSSTTLIIFLRIYSDMFRLLEAIFRLNIKETERERERMCVCACVCVCVYIYVYYNAVKWTRSRLLII